MRIFAIWALLLLTPAVLSQAQEPDESLQQEWRTIQQGADGRERANWWRHLNPDRLDSFIKAGVDVNISNRSGDTPLHWAAAQNTDVDVLTMLIEAGADVNTRDRFGWLPLHTAAESNPNPEIIDTLLAARSKRNKRAYFLLFSPGFLLKHNDRMSATDKKIALSLLKEEP